MCIRDRTAVTLYDELEKDIRRAFPSVHQSVGKVQMPAELPTDQTQLDAYIKAQAQLGGALSRLLIVAEQYPQLKATENFRTLQD